MPKKNTAKKFTLFTLFRWMIVLCLWGVLVLGSIVIYHTQDLPDFTKITKLQRRPSLTILDQNGTIIERYGDLQGQNVEIQELPTHLVQAVLGIEDRRFYNHFGLDPRGIARAMVRNIKAKRFVEGGSTITQQLAKNLFFTPEKTLKRKIQEAVLAIKLENTYTKNEILAAYLNRVYLGSGAYGIDAAAHLYFNKSATKVTLAESALLAGLLQAPTRYSPRNNPDLSFKRMRVVLRAMDDAEYIEQHERKISNPLIAGKSDSTTSPSTNIRYFTDWATDRLDGYIGRVEDDLIITTTLNTRLQRQAENALKRQLDTLGKDKNISQGAALLMKPDGQITAMIGGADYNKSQFNRATQALRQPGSSFKPFVYLAALSNGWKMNDLIEDSPVKIGKYAPKNFGGKYYGQVTLKEAIAKSLNSVAVRLAHDIGIRNVIDQARDVGITTELPRDLSIALGSANVRLKEMVSAYATLPNNGYSVEPYAITKIETSKGKILFERKENDNTYTQYNGAIIEEQKVHSMNEMLMSVINEGTGRRAQIGRAAAGKSGTSQNSRDAWFVGYTADYVAGVWLGNDDNSPMKKVTGGSIPALIWKDIMTAAHKGLRNRPLPIPSIEEKIEEKESGFTNLLENLLGQDIEIKPPKTTYND